MSVRTAVRGECPTDMGRGCHGALAYRTYPLPIGSFTQL